MPSKIITDAFVRNVKSPRKDDKHKQLSFIHTLERGLALVLVVSYGGTRTFRVMTYLNGKPRSVKLGTYPGGRAHEDALLVPGLGNPRGKLFGRRYSLSWRAHRSNC